MGKCCREVVKECCGEVLYGEVLRAGVVEKCCGQVL